MQEVAAKTNTIHVRIVVDGRPIIDGAIPLYQLRRKIHEALWEMREKVVFEIGDAFLELKRISTISFELRNRKTSLLIHFISISTLTERLYFYFLLEG